jgi:hypothetical protein
MPYFPLDRVRVCVLLSLMLVAHLGFSQAAGVPVQRLVLQSPPATAASSESAHSSLGAKTIPHFGHVFVVVEENHSYSNVIGNLAMPYLNGLAKQYGLATEYYANTHPSIGNYFMMTTGQIITNDDSFMGTVSADNAVRRLITGGKTWKSYAESLPNVGYIGGDVYPYVRHHNPLSYLSDVVHSRSERNNLVPFTQFLDDLNNNHLPQYSFIVPNMLNDAHDGSLGAADNWLRKNIGPLLGNSAFRKDGLLVILFDESLSSDRQHGGGHVAAVVISPKAKRSYQSRTLYQHQSVCRLLLEGLGLKEFPGAAKKARAMGEFF